MSDNRPSWVDKYYLYILLGGIIVFGALGNYAQADVITEFGGGRKNPSTTSVVMQERCHEVVIVETRPDSPDINFRGSSCGGDDPIFSGWPVAYQKDFGVWTVRAGWFHYSHWFDGGRDRELHLDCIPCATVTFNWTKWKDGRKKSKR